MSITLVAHPMAFLLSPQSAKNNKIKLKNSDDVEIHTASQGDLVQIKIQSNLRMSEVKELMSKFAVTNIGNDTYYFYRGLSVKWESDGRYTYASIADSDGGSDIQSFGEAFFQELDGFAKRNTRVVNSKETFYYIYETDYKDIRQIYSALKSNGAKNVYPQNDGVIANLDGQQLRYFSDKGKFFLETENVIEILNIGVTENISTSREFNAQYKDLKIKTNIKPLELKMLLDKANYLLYKGNMQTPLKSSNVVLNWELSDGYYNAVFSGTNNLQVNKEAEILFSKLNGIAGRDVRLVNDISTIIYSYQTNYTDKAILLNTLTEHGATDIVEEYDTITCKVFGLEMKYFKSDENPAFELEITQVSKPEDCESIVNDLNDEYGLNVQEITYNKIKERLDQENLRLESETVLDDNSIVLTIEV